jgi:hypothetical protein
VYESAQAPPSAMHDTPSQPAALGRKSRFLRDFFRYHIELGQLVRAEGGDHRNVRRVPAPGDQDTADPARVASSQGIIIPKTVHMHWTSHDVNEASITETVIQDDPQQACINSHFSYGAVGHNEVLAADGVAEATVLHIVPIP